MPLTIIFIVYLAFAVWGTESLPCIDCSNLGHSKAETVMACSCKEWSYIGWENCYLPAACLVERAELYVEGRPGKNIMYVRRCLRYTDNVSIGSCSYSIRGSGNVYATTCACDEYMCNMKMVKPHPDNPGPFVGRIRSSETCKTYRWLYTQDREDYTESPDYTEVGFLEFTEKGDENTTSDYTIYPTDETGHRDDAPLTGVSLVLAALPTFLHFLSSYLF